MLWIIARKFLLVALVGTCLKANAAGLEYISVQAQGEGQTLSHATASALTSAVGQVNGTAIDATQINAEMMLALDTGTESVFAASSSSSDVIAQRTQGAVRQYRVLSSNQELGVWTVLLEAEVARYERSVQANRLRMTVLPFRTQGGTQTQHGDAFVNELNTFLTQTRRFAMLDRAFEKERLEEMAIASSDSAPLEEMARLGNRLGTDYMLVGTIDQAATITRRTELAGRTIATNTGHFSVSYRVIDAATGQVKFADNWSRSNERESVTSLRQKASEAISRQIIESIFPIAVESISGDIVFLGQGGRSVKVGQKYRLLQYGDRITDSYSGESLGFQEHDIGLLEIIEVQSRLAKAKVVRSTLDLQEHFSQGKFVVRLYAESDAGQRSVSQSRTTSRPAPEPVKSVQQDLESDW